MEELKKRIQETAERIAHVGLEDHHPAFRTDLGRGKTKQQTQIQHQVDFSPDINVSVHFLAGMAHRGKLDLGIDFLDVQNVDAEKLIRNPKGAQLGNLAARILLGHCHLLQAITPCDVAEG